MKPVCLCVLIGASEVSGALYISSTLPGWLQCWLCIGFMSLSRLGHRRVPVTSAMADQAATVPSLWRSSKGLCTGRAQHALALFLSLQRHVAL